MPIRIAALLLVLCVPAGASAYSVGASASVQFPGGPVSQSISEQDGRTFASVDTGQTGNVGLGSQARARAAVDLGSRSLRIFVGASGPSINPSASAFGNVEITIQPTALLEEGEIVPVPFSMTVTGVASLDDPGFCLQASALMKYGFVVAQPALDAGCALLGALPIVTMSNVANVVVGQPTEVIFQLGAALHLGAATPIGVGGLLDASQTAVVEFEFPADAVVTSDPPEFLLPEPAVATGPLAAALALAGLRASRASSAAGRASGSSRTR